MGREVRAACVLLVSVGIVGCSSEQKSRSVAPPSPRPWVAMVAGEPITSAEFLKAFAPLEHEYRKIPAHEAPPRMTVKKALLDTLIEQRLLRHEADRLGIKVSKKVVDRAVTLASVGYDRDSFEETLLASGQTLSQFKEKVRDKMRVEELFRRIFKKVKVTEAEAKKRFAAEPKRFVLPEAVRALHIAVRTEPEARKLREQIEQGVPFEKLAKKHSVSPDARKGGDLGFFTKGQLPRVFEEVCFKLEPGQLSAVTPSEYGYHLFKVVERRPFRARTFEEARKDILGELRREKQGRAEAAYREKLRKLANMRIDIRALQRVR